MCVISNLFLVRFRFSLKTAQMLFFCAVFFYRARLRKLVHWTLWSGRGDVSTKGSGCMLDEIKARSLFLSRPPTLALGRWRGSFDEFLQRPTSLACDAFFSNGEQRFTQFYNILFHLLDFLNTNRKSQDRYNVRPSRNRRFDWRYSIGLIRILSISTIMQCDLCYTAVIHISISWNISYSF